VFEDTNALGTSIRLNEYDSNGVLVSSGTTVVSDGSLADPNYRNPHVAVSSATSVMIVYEEVTGGNPGIYCKIYNPSTNTYGAQIGLITGGVSGTGTADVAVLTNGNYVITANRGDTDNSITYRIMNSAGGNVLNASFVTGTNTNTQNDREATVTALTSGGFVIAFTNTDANDTDIQFRVYNAAGTQTGAGEVAVGSATNNNNESKVIALADGSFVIAYDNDEVLGVNVQHFSATGVSLGAPFIVSADNANSISGVALGDGRFALVWDISSGEIQMEILDTRDVVNNPAVYTPVTWQVGTVGDDVFTATNATGIAHGWDGNDVITEGSGSVQIFGDDGSDRIIVTSGIGSDLWDGGAGVDTIDWSAVSETGATFDLQAGTATDATANVEVMVNFESLIGTVNRDIVIGTSGANALQGNSGNDDLYGAAGADRLSGNDGDDFIYGGAGNDTLDGGLGNDRLDGGADVDTVNYSAAGSALYIDLRVATQANTGGLGTDVLSTIENVIGGAFADVLIGSTGANTLYGGAGADALVTVEGDDFAYGGAGDDYIAGREGNDTLFGDNDNDVIDGGAGLDTLRGEAGDDYIIGGADADTIYGGDGAANTGDLGDRWLGGDGGDDVIYGNLGIDRLSGGAGNDTLTGGEDYDYMTGEAGVDTFVYNAVTDGSISEQIGDWQGGVDKLRIDASAFGGGLAAGPLAANQLVIGTVANQAFGQFLYNAANGVLYWDADGTGAGAAVAFTRLFTSAFTLPPATLAAGDFDIVA
jgi:Ca2+-binding RTX toxin-like protein